MKTGIAWSVLTAVLISLLLLSACSTVKEVVAFDYSYQLPRQSFSYTPGSVKSGEEVIYTGQYYLNLDSILHANGFSEGVVGKTCFTGCQVVIDQPAGATFSWLQSVNVGVSRTTVFDSVVQVGYKTDIDPSADSISLTMTMANIRPYLGNNVFYFRLAGSPRIKSTSPPVGMHIDSRVLLHLQPLN